MPAHFQKLFVRDIFLCLDMQISWNETVRKWRWRRQRWYEVKPCCQWKIRFEPISVLVYIVIIFSFSQCCFGGSIYLLNIAIVTGDWYLQVKRQFKNLFSHTKNESVSFSNDKQTIPSIVFFFLFCSLLLWSSHTSTKLSPFGVFGDRCAYICRLSCYEQTHR